MATMNSPARFIPLLLAATSVATLAQQPQQPRGDGQSFRLRSTVELINVTATVTDRSGRFVPGLRREDFRVFEDGEEQTVTHFSADRVPVSLGIALDTSNSMDGEKIVAARGALNRFLYDLLDPTDEVFLYRFSDIPQLVESWTTDRRRLQSVLNRLQTRGGTAMYDAVAEAVPLAQRGHHQKKALVIISDGNDTNSRTDPYEIKQLIRQSEVMVYAIGIDGQARRYTGLPPQQLPLPFPFPGRRTPPRGGVIRTSDERVNVAALRDITDDSGGRTEIVRDPRDLDPATAGIADELSKQYYLGYPATGKKDGRWHSIRVEVRNSSYRIRARPGYVATP
jgi:Ca-activated chloride channel family protein